MQFAGQRTLQIRPACNDSHAVRGLSPGINNGNTPPFVNRANTEQVYSDRVGARVYITENRHHAFYKFSLYVPDHKIHGVHFWIHCDKAETLVRIRNQAPIVIFKNMGLADIQTVRKDDALPPFVQDNQQGCVAHGASRYVVRALLGAGCGIFGIQPKPFPVTFDQGVLRGRDFFRFSNVVLILADAFSCRNHVYSFWLYQSEGC